MIQQIQMVEAFHNKFGVPVLKQPALIAQDRSLNRHRLMKDEVEEYLGGVQKGDLPNIAKELADILYAVYGTILEHGLQDKMEAVFAEVHKSNMSKEAHEYKMVKGPGYVKANTKQFFENKNF